MSGVAKPHSSASGCKNLHAFFQDVFAGYHYQSSSSRPHQSTNRYLECFMCPFTASETQFSLAKHFHSAHIRPAMSKLLLGESAASISALETVILMHHASIRHVPCHPPHTRDQGESDKERSQFHWKHRSYNRAQAVVRPNPSLFPTIFARAVKLARCEVQRDWVNMRIAARGAAEGWGNLRSPEVLNDPDLGGAQIIKAIRDAEAETARAEKMITFFEGMRKSLGAPEKRGDREPWGLIAYRNIDPALKAAAAGELPNWGPALSQGVRKTSRKGGKRPRVYGF